MGEGRSCHFRIRYWQCYRCSRWRAAPGRASRGGSDRTVEDFGTAIKLIAEGKPINYEGAYDADDWDAVGDMFPPLVHWKVENQQFVEYELYRCSPQQPLCPVK